MLISKYRTSYMIIVWSFYIVWQEYIPLEKSTNTFKAHKLDIQRNSSQTQQLARNTYIARSCNIRCSISFFCNDNVSKTHSRFALHISKQKVKAYRPQRNSSQTQQLARNTYIARSCNIRCSISFFCNDNVSKTHSRFALHISKQISRLKLIGHMRRFFF